MSADALPIDFRRAPLPRGRWAGWLALLAAALLAAVVAQRYGEIDERRAAAEQRHELLAARRQGAAAQRAVAPPDPRTLAALQRARLIIDELALPWLGLLDAVESADAAGLGLLSLQPNARDRSVRLVGEARTLAEVLAYVERLAAQPALQQVHLLGYKSLVRDGANIVSFQVAATWKR
ncbi:MAG TPA: hypothetical protein VLI72_10580 [Methylibium sp.]|nr:hypothetical protein [Methylibium sp.]